jgi:hypothetical protein
MAQARSTQLEQQLGLLRQWLGVPVAQCKDCQAAATVSHVAMRQCPTTGNTASMGFELLQAYKGAKGAFEVLRDLSALVGAGVVIAGAARRLDSPTDEG